MMRAPTADLRSDQPAIIDVRARFPILARAVHGRPLVYLDSAATSQKPAAVLRAVLDFYRRHNANAHRGLHTLAAEATEAYEECRRRVARWLDAPDPAGVIFTRNATAALNLLARGLGHQLRAGDEILLTEMEHHANLVPWIMLAERRGIVLRHIPITGDGRLDHALLPRLLSHRTRVVSLTHVSNVLGTINPIAEIAAAARRRGAAVVLDAAQSVGHLPVSLTELGVDALVCSGHKCYGPLGVGILAGRREFLETLQPCEGGGEMINEVHLDRATWAPLPQRLEPGTADVAAVVGLQAAIDLVEALGPARIRAHELDLLAYALAALTALGGMQILGPLDPQARGGLVSFNDPGIHPHDLATLLDARGVAVRSGHHCAQPLHRKLGLPASTRISFAVHNTRADIDAFIEGLREARRTMARGAVGGSPA